MNPRQVTSRRFKRCESTMHPTQVMPRHLGRNAVWFRGLGSTMQPAQVEVIAGVGGLQAGRLEVHRGAELLAGAGGLQAGRLEVHRGEFTTLRPAPHGAPANAALRLQKVALRPIQSLGEGTWTSELARLVLDLIDEIDRMFLRLQIVNGTKQQRMVDLQP